MSSNQALAMGITLLAAVAASPAPGADAPAPADIVLCELDITPDLAGRRLAVRAALTLDNPSLARDFTFLLADWYTDVTVTSRRGPATFDRQAGAITVRVAEPVRDERLVFELAGAAGRSRGEARDVMADSSLFLLWEERFYPADFDDWSVMRIRVPLPERFQVWAPGRLIADSVADGARTWEFETSGPIRMATVIADSRWVEARRTVNGWPIRTLLHPGSRHWADSIAATSADVLEFYQSRYGPYAFDGFTFATVDGIFARRSVAGGVIYAPAYLDEEMRRTGHDAHETALLWWFGTTAGRGPGSYQWTEGFGDYAEFLYAEARGKPIPPDFWAYRNGYLAMAGAADEPTIDEPRRGRYWGNFVHGRLPFLMHLLRFAVGDSAFARANRLLFERWRFRSFTLDEFVATLAEGAGQPLDWLQDEWLARGGVPELAWRSVAARTDAGWMVSVTVEQRGELYHLPLEIGIQTEAGTRYERVRLDDRSAKFTFRSESEPKAVTLDPHRWVLAKIVAR